MNLKHTRCDCAEWRRLNEACADLMRERDQAIDSLRARDSLMVAFKEKAELEANELRELIDVHNNACHAACVSMEATRGCGDYTRRGRTCPDCPMEWIIDLPDSTNA